MNKTPEEGTPTQVAHPWRATLRTAVAFIVGLAALAPMAYEAATQGDAGAASGWAGGILVVSGAITRIMAHPAIEEFLRRFLPFLASGVHTEIQRNG